jgi:hypothetical protein
MAQGQGALERLRDRRNGPASSRKPGPGTKHETYTESGNSVELDKHQDGDVSDDDDSEGFFE